MLRGLEHFARADERDERLGDAVDASPGRPWPTYMAYPGRQWFEPEPPGPSRWKTARTLRVLQGQTGEVPV